MFTAALRGLALLALADIATGDISSVDVFVHGEHPLCPCLRIPSIAATNRSLYAFAECREWLGDGCDPLGVHSGSGPVRIAMKHSANGGVQWSPLTILTVGCQPTAVYDESTDTLLFMFKNDTHSTANLMTTKGDDPTGWTSPRVVIDPRTQEKHHRPLFPGPGRAVVLSSTHPTHPHRILFPVWLGPDGATTSASLHYTDDGGATFKQTETTWPHDGNDESTIVELTNGDVLYITRSNSSPCSAQDTSSRCLELQRSTDGGQSFAQIGAGTANPGLAGPPCDISAVSVSAINHTINHNYWSYDWKPCKRDGNHWAELPTPGLSSFEIYEKEPAGRSSWVNISVQASPANTCSEKTWPCFLEGSAAGPKSACDGAPDYAGAANIKAACGFHGTETCFGLLPLGAVTRAMRYGDIVLFHDGAKYSMDTKRRELSYLDPQTGRFSKSLGAFHRIGNSFEVKWLTLPRPARASNGKTARFNSKQGRRALPSMSLQQLGHLSTLRRPTQPHCLQARRSACGRASTRLRTAHRRLHRRLNALLAHCI